jgi:hypothetical protein
MLKIDNNQEQAQYSALHVRALAELFKHMRGNKRILQLFEPKRAFITAYRLDQTILSSNLRDRDVAAGFAALLFKHVPFAAEYLKLLFQKNPAACWLLSRYEHDEMQ